jgi:hypothetical protein
MFPCLATGKLTHVPCRAGSGWLTSGDDSRPPTMTCDWTSIWFRVDWASGRVGPPSLNKIISCKNKSWGHFDNSAGGWDQCAGVGLRPTKEGRLVHHRGCRCAERRWPWHGGAVKGNDCHRWSSDGVVLWLGRMQNGDTIECRKESSRLRWPYYSSGEWELDGSERVAGDGGGKFITSVSTQEKMVRKRRA